MIKCIDININNKICLPLQIQQLVMKVGHNSPGGHLITKHDHVGGDAGGLSLILSGVNTLLSRTASELNNVRCAQNDLLVYKRPLATFGDFISCYHNSSSSHILAFAL